MDAHSSLHTEAQAYNIGMPILTWKALNEKPQGIMQKKQQQQQPHWAKIILCINKHST